MKESTIISAQITILDQAINKDNIKANLWIQNSAQLQSHQLKNIKIGLFQISAELEILGKLLDKFQDSKMMIQANYFQKYSNGMLNLY